MCVCVCIFLETNLKRSMQLCFFLLFYCKENSAICGDVVPDICALLSLCGPHKIKQWIKLYFYAYTLKSFGFSILENCLQYLGIMKINICRCSEGVKLMVWGCSSEQVSVSVANEQGTE